jgi:amino acid adenylation domain-containing protein
MYDLHTDDPEKQTLASSKLYTPELKDDSEMTLSVPELVAAQSALTPNGTALLAREDVITYSELDARSNQVAHVLCSLGVGPDVLVALCMSRSVNLVVGALAVLKAGGAYLPLDPTYPTERLSWMLRDAQPTVVLTGEGLLKAFSSGDWQTLDLDIDGPRIATHSTQPIKRMAGPENLAYVIYTSGSTGRPKGVQVTHASLLNLVSWHRAAFAVKSSDRATQIASPGFDAAVWELWPYLSLGASVRFVDDAVRTDPELLRDWMLSKRITIAFVPTPIAERMITLDWPRQTALRILLTGADTLRNYPPSNLPFTLVNNYGPTECTVVATSAAIASNEHRDGLPSIGRPISNVQIHILNEQLENVPTGTIGEIYIGGAGLARGYLNAPDLTAARFVTNPFDAKSSTRLYKTGDLGCYLPDGQIAFRGRIDEQIKIRGYRVEPNEIIAALAMHPGIQASAVVAVPDPQGNKQLVAYVVAKPESTLATKSLREFLSSRLPEYMVPTLFVRMDSLPANASGKVDRNSLPPPNESNLLRDEAYVAARTKIEQRIAEVLVALLGIGNISIDDNFFMLGGHSLLGTQLIARLRQIFGVELTLRNIFESPTIAMLAKEIEQRLYARLEAMTEGEAEQLLRGAAL